MWLVVGRHMGQRAMIRLISIQIDGWFIFTSFTDHVIIEFCRRAEVLHFMQHCFHQHNTRCISTRICLKYCSFFTTDELL